MELNVSFWVKFAILFVPLSIVIFIMAPTLKWKLLYQPAIAVGIFLALSGKSMRRRK